MYDELRYWKSSFQILMNAKRTQAFVDLVENVKTWMVDINVLAVVLDLNSTKTKPLARQLVRMN